MKIFKDTRNSLLYTVVKNIYRYYGQLHKIPYNRPGKTEKLGDKEFQKHFVVVGEK